jgi:hypothetical protein|tara:strand:- start:343 stop:546 length:204 start_codon:yes stop_codon:yes gene_type:complete
MNLYEIIMEVLKAARDKGVSLDNDWELEDIATEIYDMYYSSEMITSYISSGYMEDLKDYWEDKPLND